MPPSYSQTVNPEVVESLVMHRGPMLLIDEVIEHTRDRIVARTTVTANSPCATKSGVPGWICIEYMAQAIAAHASILLAERQEGMLLGSRHLQLHIAELQFGQRLRIRASSIFSTVSELGMYDCEVISDADDQVLAVAKVKAVRSNNLVQFLKNQGQL